MATRISQLLSRTDFEKLWDAFPVLQSKRPELIKPETWWRTRRNRVILQVLRSTGVRVSELCSIRIGNVDTGSDSIDVVSGQSGRKRVFRIDCECQRYLSDWLAGRSGEPTTNALFPKSMDRPEVRLQPEGVYRIVRRLGERAGLPFPVSPRMSRHSPGWDREDDRMATIDRQLGIESTKTIAMQFRQVAGETRTTRGRNSALTRRFAGPVTEQLVTVRFYGY